MLVSGGSAFQEERKTSAKPEPAMDLKCPFLPKTSLSKFRLGLRRARRDRAAWRGLAPSANGPCACSVLFSSR